MKKKWLLKENKESTKCFRQTRLREKEETMRRIITLVLLITCICVFPMLIAEQSFAAVKTMRVLSDNNWKSSDNFQSEWETLAFDDSSWRSAYAPYPYLESYPVTYWIPNTNAVYMWDYSTESPTLPDGTNGPSEAWFRKTIDLPVDVSKILSAEIIIGADDDFDLFVNGNLVLRDDDGSVWSAPFSVDVKDYLVNGKNVFAVYAKDTFGGYEWVLVDAVIEYESPYFTDVTSEAGLSGIAAWRISIADVNGDMYPDLLFHQPQDEVAGDVIDKQLLFLNVKGDNPTDLFSRKFINFTNESGIRANRQGTQEGRHSSAAVFADVDNDGDLDMFSIVYVHTNYSLYKNTNDLFINDGNGHFSLAANSTFHTEPIYNTAAAVFMDYDNDSKIDLFIGNWYMNGQVTRDQLYKGQGNGVFTNVTTSSGIQDALTAVYAVASADWNGDGYIDLFAPSYSHTSVGATSVFWKNNGDGTFTQGQAGIGYSDYTGYGSGMASFGTMPRDFDNDGDIDFFEILTHGYGDGANGTHSTVVSNENGTCSWDFYKVVGRVLDDPDLGHHGDHYASWFDIDNDGLSDFVLTECGYGNNRLYLFKQSENHTFHLVTSESGLSKVNQLDLPAHNASPLDFDLDGDEDLIIGFASSDGIQLWRNDVGNSNNWITVTLAGSGTPEYSNKSGIGARVRVSAGGKTYEREVYAGNGQFGPQVPLSLTFGIGQSSSVDSIMVFWPNQGHSSTEVVKIAANQFLRIRELRGDLNEDGCVDLVDLEILLADIRGSSSHDPSFDLNNDGKVNIADARKLVTLFTAPCP